MTKEEFQSHYGSRWAVISQDPAFVAAMQMAYNDELTQIATLTREEIQTHSVSILARLQGHLAHEENLMALAIVDKPLIDLPEETYEDVTNDVEPDLQSDGIPMSGPFIEFQQAQAAQAAVPPKPKKRKKRRKRRVKPQPEET